jgi:hypothetical protein
MPGQGRQHRDHDRGTGPVYARLAKLFRVLSDAGSAAVLKQLGATETAMCALAAVENSATPQSSSACTRGRPRLASSMAGSGRGPWYLALTHTLHVWLSNAYFKSLGVPSLIEE